MKANELLQELRESVKEDEWKRLEEDDPTLVINSFNRSVVLSLRDAEVNDHEVDAASANELRRKLEQYLNKYMADKPQGHKWIIISSIYRSFIARLPMHPQEAAKWKAVEEGGTTRYLCPIREDTPDSVCLYCVCERANYSVSI
ncbi:MAG: DUF2115 family protein [Coriobacteriales bacterium]|jgi:uncharacterized protein (UPF0305 family)